MFGKPREKISEYDLLLIPHEGKVRREVPTCQVNMRSRVPELRSDQRERVRAVDEHVE